MSASPGLLCDPDDKGAAGGLDHVVGDDGEFVDFHDALDLREQAMQESEIAASEAGDRSNGLGVCEIRAVAITL